jgi:16S rRNA (guanine966-N2)-methyltransferase
VRIISGWARGRKLLPPSGDSGLEIRPTADRAKEAIFSIIGNKIGNSHVLDLYAGTGSLGLEALSRGAGSVTFVDLNPQAIELIKKNIRVCRLPEDLQVSVIKHDLRKGLPGELMHNAARQQFNLIFLDPPYSQGLSLKTLEFLANCPLLTIDGLIIAEERRNERLPERQGPLVLMDQRNYGDTGFWLYTLYTPPAEENK